jgi:hypothetical protein
MIASTLRIALTADAVLASARSSQVMPSEGICASRLAFVHLASIARRIQYVHFGSSCSIFIVVSTSLFIVVRNLIKFFLIIRLALFDIPRDLL